MRALLPQVPPENILAEPEKRDTGPAIALGIGWVAGRVSTRISLGFVAETERQVEQHLAQHLTRLPAADLGSRAIVEQMKADEARHAEQAELAGAARLPLPVRWLMRAAAKVMTTTAHRI